MSVRLLTWINADGPRGAELEKRATGPRPLFAERRYAKRENGDRAAACKIGNISRYGLRGRFATISRQEATRNHRAMRGSGGTAGGSTARTATEQTYAAASANGRGQTYSREVSHVATSAGVADVLITLCVRDHPEWTNDLKRRPIHIAQGLGVLQLGGLLHEVSIT